MRSLRSGGERDREGASAQTSREECGISDGAHGGRPGVVGIWNTGSKSRICCLSFDREEEKARERKTEQKEDKKHLEQRGKMAGVKKSRRLFGTKEE